MPKLAFKMKLHSGQEAEYKKRHDEIWPELVDLLHSHGISDYSIFLDPTTLDLIGILNIQDTSKIDELPQNPIMQKWWAYMKDIMETNEDNSPISIALENVFYME